MADPNPYQAPQDLPQDSPTPIRQRGLAVAIEFESDWSPEGLSARRDEPWHRKFDLVFALVTVGWVGSLLLSIRGPYSTIFCILTPVWVMMSITWLFNLSYRNGGSFHRRFPGLAGKVSGKIDAGLLRIDGPALSLAVRTRDCVQCLVHADRAMLQPPGIDTVLPVVRQDIRNSWTYEPDPPADAFDVADLLNEFNQDDAGYRVQGRLRGWDMRGQPCFRNWMSVGIASSLIAVLLAGWGIYELIGMPSWIANPPAHYAYSDEDMREMMIPIIAFSFSAFTAAFAFWHFAQPWRNFGDYTALITPQRVAITRRRMAVSYHGEALGHFQWTRYGLVAANANRSDMFLLPTRWFDEESRQSIQHWFDRTPNRSRQSYYVGPTV